jgi:integrase
MCGLQPGELLGLRWEDIDTAERVIRVRKAVKVMPATADAKSHVIIDDLKTERSRRTLEMPKAVASMLTALRRDQAAGKLRLGTAWEDHGLVFAGPAGRPQRPEPVRRRFGEICEAAGLGAGWHPAPHAAHVRQRAV